MADIPVGSNPFLHERTLALKRVRHYTRDSQMVRVYKSLLSDCTAVPHSVRKALQILSLHFDIAYNALCRVRIGPKGVSIYINSA